MSGVRRISDELLTVQEVAARMGVGDQAVRDWIAAGDLAAIKIGGRTGYRISLDDLDAFLLRRRMSAGIERMVQSAE